MTENMKKIFGFDLDNTIVCYEKVFRQSAQEIGISIPSGVSAKNALREHYRINGNHNEFTRLQGFIYGPGMALAEPFEDVIIALHSLRRMGYSLCIISHRSLQPYAGPAYDLHTIARKWIKNHFAEEKLFSDEQIHLLETREKKITAIKALRCNIFLDDLPEVLSNNEFPKKCLPILFDPESCYKTIDYACVKHWTDLQKLIQEKKS